MTLASCTNPPTAETSRDLRTQTCANPTDGFRHTGTGQPRQTGCPSLPVSVRRAPRRQGQAAPRWPPASLDSSYAQRNRQLREEQGENRTTMKHRFQIRLAPFKITDILPGYPFG